MQVSDILTSLINELQLITSGFCSSAVKKYWLGRGITNLTLDHFDVRAYNPRKRSLTTILETKGFTAEDIKPILHGKSGKHELFGHGSLIPARYNRSIWNLIYIPLVGLKMYCSSIQLKHPFNIDEALQSDGPVIVCEAPIDCMSAWQLGVRSVISTFGTQFDPLDFSPFMGRQLTTLFDNDPAGKMASEKFQRKYLGSKSAFVPAPFKDVNEFLVGGGTSEALQEIVRNAVQYAAAEATTGPQLLPVDGLSKILDKETVPNFLEDNRELFYATHKGKEIRLHPPMYDVHTRFAQYFNDLGFPFIFDKSREFPTLFLGDRTITFRLEDLACRHFLYEQIKLYSMQSSWGKEFVQSFGDFIFSSERAKIVDSVYFACTVDEVNYYYTGNDKILRVACGNVTQIKNGLNDFQIGLLAPEKPFTAWDYCDRACQKQAIDLLKKLYLDSLALDPVDRIPSLAFNLTHLTPNLSLRPLRESSGNSGSGKSEEAKLYSFLISGHLNVCTFKTAEELWLHCDRNFFICVDNLEAERAYGFFELFTVGATGGSGIKRQLFKSEKTLEYHLNGLLTKTSIRCAVEEEVIQRCVTFQFDHCHHRGDYNYELVRKEILKNRPVILSGIFQIMSEEILPHRSNYDSFADQFLKTIDHPRKRLNLFFREMILWIAAICKYLGQDWEPVAKNFFAKTARQYAIDVSDSDPVLQTLVAFKEYVLDPANSQVQRRYSTQINIANLKLIISGYASQFFTDWMKTNRFKTEKFFRTPRSLGQRLRGIRPNVIKTIGWTLDKEERNQGIYYTFTYDLSRDSSETQTHITAEVQKELDGLRSAGRDIVRLEEPMKTVAAALIFIQSRNPAAVEIPSVNFIGDTDQTTIEIIRLFRGHKIPIIFGMPNVNNQEPLEQ